ncbi:hypothetical protein [Streptomyces bohaiensis]|uniref:ABC transporter permease n=1 Tax=Streptomyces bohaiensis TaxID=1431344 RepID=A0ABX1CG59_9ACTN|nr:hypothetical protein [Streptomyces bohaiensis]NJQ16820.1 hypothetical protein [Streptomyces bohaiensis]
MNLRVLRTELLRSVAPWAGATVLGGGAVLLHLLGAAGPAAGTTDWTGQWTATALWTRTTLVVLLPLVVGLGALHGLRDHRSGTDELLAATSRPAPQRAALPMAALALALVVGFGTLVAWGAVRVATGETTHHHAGWLPITAVALLALVAGAVLGAGAARALPSPLTPPVLVVLCLVANVFLVQHSDAAHPTSQLVPHLLSQFTPAVAEPRQVLLTPTVALHLGQSVWLLSLLACGFLLLAVSSTRARLLAVVPAVAGALLALPLLPAAPRDGYRVDAAAAAWACEGRVCVAELHRYRLAELAPAGEEALAVLADALGPDAPERVREETALRAVGSNRPLEPGVLLVHFEDPTMGGASGDQLVRRLVGEGLAPDCWPRTTRESGSDAALVVQSVLASWALGEFALIDAEVYDAAEYRGSAESAWAEFTALDPAEQRSRAAEIRAGALECAYTWPEELAGGPA